MLPPSILCFRLLSQTLTRSTHAYAELGNRQPACIRTTICTNYWAFSTTTPLHAHVVCVCDQHVRARWAWRWRWWRQASLPFLLGRKMSIWRYDDDDAALLRPPLQENADKATDNCKNEHPTGQGNSQSQGGFGNNRFAALNNNQGGAGNRSGAFGSSTFAPSYSSLDQATHFIPAPLDTFTSTTALQQTWRTTTDITHSPVILHYTLRALLSFGSYCSQTHNCDDEPLATKLELY